MNCHNGSQYLLESINSVLNQTFYNWELIFWDNKSTDDTKNIILNLKDKRIKYFYSKNFYKLYKSRNLAIKKARGSYICFLDTDDFWKKNFLKLFLKKIKEKNCKIVFSKYLIKNENKNKLYLPYKKKLPEFYNTQNLLDNYLVSVNAIMIKKEIFNKYKFDNNYNIIGDFDLFLRLSKKFNFYIIDKPLVVYRIHKSNFSHKLNIHLLELKKWLKKDSIKLSQYNLKKFNFFLIKLHIKFFLSKLGLF